MCRLYGKFTSYLRRVLCKTCLIFPRIKGPIVHVTQLDLHAGQISRGQATTCSFAQASRTLLSNLAVYRAAFCYYYYYYYYYYYLILLLFIFQRFFLYNSNSLLMDTLAGRSLPNYIVHKCPNNVNTYTWHFYLSYAGYRKIPKVSPSKYKPLNPVMQKTPLSNRPSKYKPGGLYLEVCPQI